MDYILPSVLVRGGLFDLELIGQPLLRIEHDTLGGYRGVPKLKIGCVFACPSAGKDTD